MSRLTTRHAQPVADVAHRLDRVGAVDLAELAAQVADVDLEHRPRVEVELLIAFRICPRDNTWSGWRDR